MTQQIQHSVCFTAKQLKNKRYWSMMEVFKVTKRTWNWIDHTAVNKNYPKFRKKKKKPGESHVPLWCPRKTQFKQYHPRSIIFNGKMYLCLTLEFTINWDPHSARWLACGFLFSRDITVGRKDDNPRLRAFSPWDIHHFYI